jgi:ribonuclease-3
VAELAIVFRTQSDVEASIVRGLLEAHGLPSILSSGAPHQLFPVSVNELGEIRLSVHAENAEEARRIIESHRASEGGERVVHLRDEFDALQRAVQYRFRDRGLLEQALTHTSRAQEDPSGAASDNESLEFLGDAVLGFIVADMLFQDFPELNEGQKSKIKASLVSTATLGRLADALSLGEHLLLGRGEEKTGGRRKQALLADAYEALIAAIYLDGGIEAAREFVGREFASLVADVKQHGLAGQDFKSALQEYLQSQDVELPEYRVVGTAGPDHRKQFQVEVIARGEPLGEGTGASKKDAEQEAARAALDKLNRSR